MHAGGRPGDDTVGKRSDRYVGSHRLIPNSSSLTDAIVEPSKQVVYVAMPKNCQFVGRRAELQILKRHMITVQDCQSLAVTGLGGIGKTELVLYFAYSVAE